MSSRFRREREGMVKQDQKQETRSGIHVSKLTHTQRKVWYGFRDYEKQRGVKATRKFVSNFIPLFRYLKHKKIHYLKFNKENAHDFETFLTNLKNADGSSHYPRVKVMAIMSMIRRFYNYLKDTGKITTHPFIKKRKMRKVKRQKQDRWKMSIPEEIQKLIDEFLEERTTEGYRDKKGMRRQVKKLCIYLNEYDLAVADVKVKQAQDYQAWLIEDRSNNGKKYASGSICNFYKGAVRFYDFLKKKGTVYSNPFLEIRRKRVKKRLPRNILKEDEMIKLLSELEHFDDGERIRNKKTKYKVHVIAELMYSTGLRAGEAARIKEPDIDFLRGSINVIDVKDGHEKTVFLNEYAKNILKIYVSEMRDLVLNENNDKRYIFGMR
ncbi:MAG: tyrosine-type recombinase/integrase, partial [Deltaproteobacteria bacterium]|nr:tyrosine-type recombinase/integrase [Deltaproteobacteria bacterium]